MFYFIFQCWVRFKSINAVEIKILIRVHYMLKDEKYFLSVQYQEKGYFLEKKH